MPHVYFLTNEKKIDSKKFKSLRRSFKDLEGSEVTMSPSKLMKDEAWSHVAPKLCQSFRKQKLIKNHPY